MSIPPSHHADAPASRPPRTGAAPALAPTHEQATLLAVLTFIAIVFAAVILAAVAGLLFYVGGGDRHAADLRFGVILIVGAVIGLGIGAFAARVQYRRNRAGEGQAGAQLLRKYRSGGRRQL